jgi:hypothetical protein
MKYGWIMLGRRLNVYIKKCIEGLIYACNASASIATGRTGQGASVEEMRLIRFASALEMMF